MVSIVTNAGKANVTAAMNAYASRPRHIQWGVGSGQGAAATALADTTGTTEARATGASEQQTTSVTNDTYQVTGTLTAAGTRTITEVGVFDAAGSGSPPSGGNMAIYGDFSAINLAADDSITFTTRMQLA